MATRSLIQLRGLFESLPGGSKSLSPLDLQNNIPPDYTLQVVLASGPNTIAVPSGINSIAGAILVFDSTSTVAKTIQGAPADTGIKLDPNGWNVLSFDAANLPSNLVVTCSAADTGKTSSVIFF